MAIQSQHLALAFGILGNLVSFMVFLAPIPTFIRIYKKKSTEDFQSLPYSVALFSSMLMLYYAFLKSNALLLITINSIGVVIESAYLVMFLIYAPRNTKINTIKLLLVFNVWVYVAIVALTYVFSSGDKRVSIVGWIGVIFSICVFAAPLAIMRRVIQTKSVEYMPIHLSLFLTLCAVVWFFYGFLIKDYYVAAPNVLGFIFGVAQMILYMMYKDANKKVNNLQERELQELGVNKRSSTMEAEKKKTVNTKQHDHHHHHHDNHREANSKDSTEKPTLIAIAIVNNFHVSK